MLVPCSLFEAMEDVKIVNLALIHPLGLYPLTRRGLHLQLYPFVLPIDIEPSGGRTRHRVRAQAYIFSESNLILLIS
jgi:hypothetical protein